VLLEVGGRSVGGVEKKMCSWEGKLLKLDENSAVLCPTLHMHMMDTHDDYRW